ncbi:MAG: DNA-directed DNA polymerase II small subunit [Candidatus Thermoplasmatota archaeon]|jgi:DNA polymerase II small subunit|nr:DNA-directed DNA polymerase II small subunit [Candidatus Thermoplasmatota archaeon]MCL5794643.1 DNA-directed DNA polymerase II small subunit [Candidatus Thermoplasmatota archaeon]
MDPLYGDRGRILEYFHSHGILVDPKALDRILKSNTGLLVESMLSESVRSNGYLSESEVISILRNGSGVTQKRYEVYAPDIRVRSSVDDFRNYFLSRYSKLKKIISLSSAMRGSFPIKSAKKVQGEVKIIGMVSDVNITLNGHKRVVLEDHEDQITVILMKDRGVARELILNDEVIGVVGSVSHGKGDPVVFANEIIRPDIPNRFIDNPVGEPAYVASLSDIHVGSKTFRKQDFRRMINWIKSSGEEAETLKYIILSGDVVDGIGVYPGQEDDLEVLNPMEQYLKLAEYVSEIPDDITVFLMPGNHDIVRLAEPQPVFPEKIRKEFPSNTVLLPNPYNLLLEDRNVLVYHGMSLNDMVELIPGMNFDTIGGAIEELLKRRHLAPRYGGKTPLIPASEDFHVIEKVPDIFITGHVHSHALGNYKGVRYVNSSTWQSQTEYQKMMNFSPKPSIMTLFDLHSRSVVTKSFES